MKFVRIDPDDIINCVSTVMGVSVDEIKGYSRKTKIVTARHTAIYLSRKYSNHKLRALAGTFNRENHSTLVNATHNVDAWISYSKHYRQLFNGVESRLRGIYVDQNKKVL